MVIFSCLLRECFTSEDWTRFGLLRSRVMLMRVWFSMVEFGRLTGLVMTLLMRLLTLVVGELVMQSLMLVVICLGSVVAGTLSFLTFIDFSLRFLEPWSIMMVGMVLLLILQYGLLVLSPRGVGLFMRFGTGHSCLATWYLTLLIGLFPLVFWLSGFLFR